MWPLFSPAPHRYAVTPNKAAVDWGHPLTDRLIRAVLFSQPSNFNSGGGALVDELVTGALVPNLGTMRDDLPGLICRCASSAAITLLDAPALTPATGQGSGGLSLVVGALVETATAANQFVSKYQTGALEYVFGVLSGGTVFGYLYDNTAAAFSGRTAPALTAGIYQSLAMVWDGGIPPKDHLQIWADMQRIDTADFTSGTFVQVRDTATDVLIGGSNPGLGATTATRFRHAFVFRRGLLPDEMYALADNPDLFLVHPARAHAASVGAAAGWGPLLGQRRHRLVMRHV